VHKSSTKASAAMKGGFTLVVCQMSDLAMAQLAISTLAAGGVCWPMARLSVSTSPKWMGSICTAAITSITIGTVRVIAAAGARI
jgi:hypothetical protein